MQRSRQCHAADGDKVLGGSVNRLNQVWIFAYADDKSGDLSKHAKALINAGLEVLVAAGGTASAKAAIAEAAATQTKTVFTSVCEPSRPADYATGICARTDELDAARLALLSELLPGQTNFGVLYNLRRPNLTTQQNKLNDAAAFLGLSPLDPQTIDPDQAAPDTEAQIDKKFHDWGAGGTVKGVVVAADPLFNNHRPAIANAASTAKIPVVYQWREFVDDGGLISYGPNLTVAYKLAGFYVGRLLKQNNSPKDHPVLPLSSYELVINLSVADALPNFTIPPKVLARADDVVF
jgi:putative ABC transport system substrate-binding protein